MELTQSQQSGRQLNLNVVVFEEAWKVVYHRPRPGVSVQSESRIVHVDTSPARKARCRRSKIRS